MRSNSVPAAQIIFRGAVLWKKPSLTELVLAHPDMASSRPARICRFFIRSA
jgi:hypothetical protein